MGGSEQLLGQWPGAMLNGKQTFMSEIRERQLDSETSANGRHSNNGPMFQMAYQSLEPNAATSPRKSMPQNAEAPQDLQKLDDSSSSDSEGQLRREGTVMKLMQKPRRKASTLYEGEARATETEMDVGGAADN